VIPKISAITTSSYPRIVASKMKQFVYNNILNCWGNHSSHDGYLDFQHIYVKNKSSPSLDRATGRLSFLHTAVPFGYYSGTIRVQIC
jgi:hypothetical protein